MHNSRMGYCPKRKECYYLRKKKKTQSKWMKTLLMHIKLLQQKGKLMLQKANNHNYKPKKNPIINITEVALNIWVTVL